MVLHNFRAFSPFDVGSLAVLFSGRRQGKQPTAEQTAGGERMQGKGMNAQELLELKAALLKAERLEVLAILRDAESLPEAVAAIEQRLRA